MRPSLEFCFLPQEAQNLQLNLNVRKDSNSNTNLYLEISAATGKDIKSIRSSINKLMKALPQYHASSAGAPDLIVCFHIRREEQKQGGAESLMTL